MTKSFYFRDVRSGRSDTVVEYVPLVMRRDDIGRDYPADALNHADFHSLYIVRQGCGVHFVDGVPYSVSRGDVYAMGMGMTHWFRDCDSLVFDTIHFSPDALDAETLDILAETPGFQQLFVEAPHSRGEQRSRWLHLTPEAFEDISQAYAEMMQEWSSDTKTGALLVRALFWRLLVRLSRYFALAQHLPVAGADTSSRVREATIATSVRYMEEHFHEQLRIEDVAATVFLSPDRFTKVFSAAMGRTPRDYLRHLRLERARTLLSETDESISAVGDKSGFSEAAHFARIFREATGLSPREYRRAYRPA